MNSLYIDENGVLWIGTREGLNRYDGRRHTNLQAAEERPLQPFLQHHRAAHGRQTVTEKSTCSVRKEKPVQSRHPKIHHPAARKCTQHILQRGPFIGKQNEIYRYNEQTGNFDLYYQLPRKKVTKSAVCIWTMDKCDWNDHRRSIPPATGQEQS